jgi:hypothetical protein
MNPSGGFNYERSRENLLSAIDRKQEKKGIVQNGSQSNRSFMSMTK